MGIYFRSKFNIFILVFIFSLSFFSNLIIWSKGANAFIWERSWSWIDNPPFTSESIPADISEIGWCAYSDQNKEIYGETEAKSVCMNEGDNISFGTYYYGSGLAFPAVVGLKGSDKMYKLNGICTDYGQCLYLPGTDTLVVKEHIINNSKSLIIYKRFSHRISLNFGGPINPTSYSFDATNPDLEFRSIDGYAWPVGGLSGSKNGKWLAIEFRQHGIGLLNIETLQMKRISALVLSYGTGYDPTSELAVSNSGKNVAVMGLNSGLTLFDVDHDCGDQAIFDSMSSLRPVLNPCKTIPLDYDIFIYNFHNSFRPKYSSDGGELSFYVTSYTDVSRKVTLRVQGYSVKKLDYLALGDSFSSGEGDLDDKNYLKGTNEEYEKCHNSTGSYPYLIINNIDSNFSKSVACSGAMITDVSGLGDYWGQSSRLLQTEWNLDLSQRISAQNDALEKFIPGRIRQIDFIKEHQPKVITIGIGGNDAGFMDKLKACLGYGTCSWAENAIDREKTAIEIKNLFDKLVQTYKDLHIASPYSKIYVIGYPKIISTTGSCDLLTDHLLDAKERTFMDEGIKYLNEVIESAALKAGVKYINIQDSFGDNVLCGSAKPSAMNSVKAGDDISPIDKINWVKIIGQESFHPNTLGHALIFKTITDSIGNLFEYDYCGHGLVVCQKEKSAPKYSSYWGLGKNNNYPSQRIAQFVSNPDNRQDNKQKNIKLESGTLLPNSDVRVEISSDIQVLGQFIANNDGSLNIIVDLPNNIDDGFHTMHLYGTSSIGEFIELYQVISYEKPIIETPIDNSYDDINDVTNNTFTVLDVETLNDEIIQAEPIVNDYVEQLGNPFDININQAIKGASVINDSEIVVKDKKFINNRSIFDDYVIPVIGLFCVVVMIAIITKTKRSRKSSGK